MNNIFTNVHDARINRMKMLQEQADALLKQRKSVRFNKTLTDGYTISICYILNSINRLADEIAEEKPTSAN